MQTQMLKRFRIFSAFLLVSGLSACNKMPGELFGPEDSRFGEIALQLESDGSITYLTAGGSTQTPGDIDLTQLEVPEADSISVYVYKNDTTLYAGFPRFAEMPAKTRLRYGNYLLKASWGTDKAAAWNSLYYAGEASFTLDSKETVPLGVTCKIQNTLATVRYNDNFRNVFKNYSAALSTKETTAPLVFKEGEKRIGCFRPADTLYLTVTVTKIDNGKTYTYGAAPIVEPKAGELHNITFGVSNGQITLNVVTDDGTTLRNYDVMLDEEWLPKHATKLTASFDEAVPVEHIYGLPYAGNLDMVIKSPMGIRDLSLHMDQALAANLNLPDSLDLLNLTPDEKAALDERLQLIWTDGTAEGSNNVRVSFSKTVNQMKLDHGTATGYTMTVKTTDLMGLSLVKSLQLQITPPEIQMSEQNMNRVWAKFAYITIGDVTNVSDADKVRFPLTYWISSDNANWECLGETAGVELYKTGLTPNTTYYVKASYEDIYSPASTFRTETGGNIGNAGFEEYWSNPFSSSNTPYYEFFIQGSGDTWWASLNPLTCFNRDASDAHSKWFRAYPVAQIVEGRTGKAVELTTVGWGDASYVTAKGNLANKPLTWEDYCEKATEGKLFIGSYDYGTQSEQQGHDFDSRPNALTFWYKYTPVNGNSMKARIEVLNGNTVIGKGEFTNGNSVGSFTQQRIVIRYNEAYKETKVTGIRIWFSTHAKEGATTSDVVLYQGSQDLPSKWGSAKNEIWDSKYLGSVLTVDDLGLEYPDTLEGFTFVDE